MIKVSVIIPVYNASWHIKECIESLINQTLKDVEFIFVNDGSTDDSGQIIESYQNGDARLILINQANKGVSAARNIGISKANGQYIGFIDADDYVVATYYETLYNIIVKKNLDIVISNFITEQGSVIKNSQLNFAFNKIWDKYDIQKELIPFFLKEDGLNSCWNKLYNSNLIKNNSIVFPVGITNGEDALFNLSCFNYANELEFINFSGYYYREVQNSATRNLNDKNFLKIALDVFNYNHKKKCNLTIPSEQILEFKTFRFINTIVALIHLYLGNNSSVNLKNQFNKVSEIVHNQQVIEILKENWIKINENKPYYHKCVLRCLKFKSVVGLWLLISYSNFRNR